MISTVVRLAADADTEVFLFGSRIDDGAKGGDVDLLIESDRALPLLQRAKIKMQLESQLGLPVDVICKTRGTLETAFKAMAKQKAIKLAV